MQHPISIRIRENEHLRRSAQVLLAMIPYCLFWAAPTHRNMVTLAITTSFNALSLGIIIRHLWIHQGERSRNGALVLCTIAGLFAGNILYQLPIASTTGLWLRGKFGLTAYTVFYAGMAWLLGVQMLPRKLEPRHLLIALLAIGAVIALTVFQSAMLGQAMLHTAHPVAPSIYFAVKGIAVILLLVSTLIIMDPLGHGFMQAALLMSVAGFAKVYDASIAGQASTCWAQCAWMIGTGVICWSLHRGSSQGRLPFLSKFDLAPWRSMRPLLAFLHMYWLAWARKASPTERPMATALGWPRPLLPWRRGMVA